MEPPKSGLTCPSTDGLPSGRVPPDNGMPRKRQNRAGLSYRLRVFVACLALGMSACGTREQASLANPGRGLRPISLPDVSQMQGPARSQVQARQVALTTALANKVSDQD